MHVVVHASCEIPRLTFRDMSIVEGGMILQRQASLMGPLGFIVTDSFQGACGGTAYAAAPCKWVSP